MVYKETTKGNTLQKFFIIIPFVFALLLHSGRNRAIPAPIPHKKRVASSFDSVSHETSVIRYPLNTSVHKETVQTAWCVLARENVGKFFYHFPHALQVLSRCWSYFMMERRKYGVTSCGFFFDMVKKTDFNFNRISPWAKDLLTVMNCSKIIRKSDRAPKIPGTDDYYYLKWTKHWFEEIDDIAPLRELVLQKRKEGYTRLNEFVNRTTAIGLIQRVPRNKRCDRVPLPSHCRHFREFINLKAIQESLAKNFPAAKIKNTKLKNMDLVEQASWWWNKDFVIAAHGASLANVMFMRPGTVVIEIFPTGYEPVMFQQLMADAGVHGYRIMNSTQKGRKGFKNRDVPLEPKVNEIVRLVLEGQRQRQIGIISK